MDFSQVGEHTEQLSEAKREECEEDLISYLSVFLVRLGLLSCFF
jgi:hypothetical protein